MSSEINKKDIKTFFSSLNISKPQKDIDAMYKYCIDHNVSKTYMLESLSRDYIKSRFFDLKSQLDHGVHFPAQRSKEWFNQRGKIRGTITGSRPSGWWFEMKDEQTYQDQLDYLYGVKKKVFTKEALARMNYGTKFEDHAMFEFIRWSVMQKRDMYIFECGFRRNKTYDNLGVPLGASPDGLVSEYFYGLVIDETESEANCIYLDEENEICRKTIPKDHVFNQSLLAAEEYDTLIKNYGIAKEELKRKLLEKANISNDDLKPIMICENSILEIKCPTKIYGNIPLYYLAQLHLEAHTYNLRKVYFTCWNAKDDKQRLRVWRLKFNDGFFSDFLDLAECFHVKRGNTETLGAFSWTTLPIWKKFKLKYGKISGWADFIKPYHTRGKFAIERTYNKEQTVLV